MNIYMNIEFLKNINLLVDLLILIYIYIYMCVCVCVCIVMGMSLCLSIRVFVSKRHNISNSNVFKSD